MFYCRFGVLLWELAVSSHTGERPQRGQLRDVRSGTPAHPMLICPLSGLKKARHMDKVAPFGAQLPSGTRFKCNWWEGHVSQLTFPQTFL